MGRFIAVVLAVVALMCVGCDNEKTVGDGSVLTVPAESGVSGPVHFNYDTSKVATRGNRSYLPLELAGNPHGHVSVILGALEAFEKAHPELEITEWKIEKQQRAYLKSPYIFGIWIDHRRRRQ